MAPPGLTVASLSDAEAKQMPKVVVSSVDIPTHKVSKMVVQPGWKWSECIKPIAGTESCQVAHSGVMVSGKMCVKMDDGTEKTFGAGDVFYIPPGHDGWVVGDEECVGYEFATLDKTAAVWEEKK